MTFSHVSLSLLLGKTLPVGWEELLAIKVLFSTDMSGEQSVLEKELGHFLALAISICTFGEQLTQRKQST